MIRLLFRVAVMAAITSIALPLDAATYTWTGATDSLWTTTTNWNPNATTGGPVAADTIVYAGATNQTINLAGAAQTVSTLTTSTVAASAVSLTATNGSLTINGNVNLTLNATSTTSGQLTYDFSGLSGFTYTAPTRTFGVGWDVGTVTGTTTLNLAAQAAGENTITAQVFQTAGVGNGNFLGVTAISLGKLNTINSSTISIGSYSNSGTVAFGTGIANGSLVLRGTAGGASRSDSIFIGANSSGNLNRTGSGWLNLTNGSLDARVTTTTLASAISNSGVGSTGVLTISSGTLDTLTLVLGTKGNGGNSTHNATVNQSGGIVLTGTARFGDITTAVATAPTFSSIYNLASGTLRAALITANPSVALTGTTTANAASVRRIAWSGGTISNYDATTDLTVSGTNTNAGYTMQLVLGSTTTPQVFNADTGRTITIGSNAVISGTGLLLKQGDGTLRINTAATYSGATSINGGMVRMGVTNGLPAATALSLAPSSGTATLDLNGFNQTVASFASSNAGSSVIDVAATGTSTLTVGGDGSSTTFAGILRNSGSSAVLNLTKNGVGTLTLTGPNSTTAGALVVNTGKITMDPGAGGGFAATGRLQLAPSAGNTATLEVLSGTNVFGTATGISGMGDNSATGTSTWQISGGSSTMQIGSNRFLIGNKGPATVRVSAGSLTFTGTQDVVIGGDIQYALNNATGAVTVAGGTLSITGSGNLYLGRNQSTGGTTTGANGTINLDGGVFASARPLTTFTGTNPAIGTVNFNGGTLRALATSANFIAVTTANVQNGGAVIDTNAFDVTVAQSLQNAGSGGLTKVGLGTLTLTASNSYAGSTAVNGGTLKAGSVNAFGAGAITVASGATLDLNSLGVANAITNNGGSVSNAASYAGSQTLTGSSTFGNLGGTVTVDNGGVATFTGAMSGGVTVNAGGVATVASAGSVAGGVSVASTGLLGGSGIVGAISGAGLVGPGNSPGILTSTGSLDPSGGLDFSFEFGGTSPTWSAASASVNDVLHLTAATPMTALGSGNTINVYLNAGSLTSGSTFLGGIFIDQTQATLDLASLVSGATFEYFVAGGSDVTYNGVGYFTLANYMNANPGITGITATTTTVASADFATGTVTNGQVMQMVVVPEPGALAIVASGALAAGWTALRRIRRR